MRGNVFGFHFFQTRYLRSGTKEHNLFYFQRLIVNFLLVPLYGPSFSKGPPFPLNFVHNYLFTQINYLSLSLDKSNTTPLILKAWSHC